MSGYWATPQPQTTATTAPTASTRVPRGARPEGRTSAAPPRIAEAAMSGQPRPHQLVGQDGASTRSDPDPGDGQGAGDQRRRRRPAEEVGGEVRSGIGGARRRRGRPPPDRRTLRWPAGPTRSDVGFSQLVHGSPAALPAGTRPLAIAPPAAPRKNGVTTDEIAKTAFAARARSARSATGRKAKAAPRRTIPSAASAQWHEQRRHDRGERRRERGPEDDEVEDQPGVVRLPDRSDRVGDERARRGPASAPPAARSQNPAPKSAPPKTA